MRTHRSEISQPKNVTCGHGAQYAGRPTLLPSLVRGVATVCILMASAAVNADVVITEFMASNFDALQDDDCEYSDWIELFNFGSSATDLNGWSLTDDPSDLTKWVFPDVVLLEGEHMVLFASGKDRRDPEKALHTNFKLSAAGEFLALVDPSGALRSTFAPEYPPQTYFATYGASIETQRTELITPDHVARYHVPTIDDAPLETSWAELDFDDSGWAEAPLPFGFDVRSQPVFDEFFTTDLADVMHAKGASIWVRIRFDINDVAAVHSLLLRMRFDDGFIAFVNGARLGSSAAPEAVKWNSTATAARRSEDSTEFDDFPLLGFKRHLRDGSNVLAIQGLNIARQSNDFLLDPTLESATVLSIDAETRVFLEPITPGSVNPSGKELIASRPEFSHPRGLFAAPFDLELTHESPDTTIRYTLDGEEPTLESPIYDGPIPIETSTKVTARSYRPGTIPSDAVRQTYLALDPNLFDFSSDLPIVVVTTFDRDIGAGAFADADIVVLDRGSDGRAMLLDEPVLSSLAGVKLRGSSTQSRPKRAYSVEIRDLKDADRDVEFLGMPAESDWILYAAFNFDRALMRNAFIYEISNQMGVYAPRTRFCEVFVAARGQPVSMSHYVGVYSVIEKIKRGEDRVDIDRLRPGDVTEPAISGGYIVKIDRLDPGDRGFNAGGRTLAYVEPKESDVLKVPAQVEWIAGFFDAFKATLDSPEFADPVGGYHQFIDVDEWIDHHLLNAFTKNPDGLALSTYLHLPREGKLAMGPIWDFDRAMGPDDDGRALSPAGWTHYFSILWWNRLFQDPAFEDRWWTRWFELRDSFFTVTNMHGVIDRFAAEIAEAQVRNFQRWPGLVAEDGGWESEVEQLRVWVAERLLWIDSQFFDSVSGPPGGVVDVGTKIVLSSTSDEIFYTLTGGEPREHDGTVSAGAVLYDEPPVVTTNVRIRARARFDSRWWGPAFDQIYITEPIRLVITEVNYAPRDPFTRRPRTQEQFIEVQNVGDQDIELAGISLVGSPRFSFGGASVQTLRPGEFGVLVRDQEEFAARYDTSEINILGEFAGQITPAGQAFTIVGPLGEVVQQFSFDGTWYEEGSANGHSIVIVDAEGEADAWNQMAGWRPSHARGGSPGRPDAPVEPGERLPGDFNRDQRLNVTDAVTLLRGLFNGSSFPPCETSTGTTRLLDANGDALLDLADAVHLLRYLFASGAPPHLGNTCVTIPGCSTSCDG